ncbi:MAG: transposase [Actinobacteria bacterium]|nr:transposase [Actinomycetota bacterium]
MRAKPRNGPSLATRRRRRLRLLRQSQPLLLGFSAARDLLARRHATRLAAHLAKVDEREVGLRLLARCRPSGGEILLGDKGYAGRAFAAAVSDMDATIVRPTRRDEPGRGPLLAPIRQRIESIFWTCKDLLTLERHGARTLPGLRERVLARFVCLAAAIALNHQLGRPSRALVNYCA